MIAFLLCVMKQTAIGKLPKLCYNKSLISCILEFIQHIHAYFTLLEIMTTQQNWGHWESGLKYV